MKVKIPAALFLIFLFLWILIPVGLASDLLFFYEQGCPECAAIRNFLNKRIKPNYPVEIKKYEIHEPGNANLLLNLARVYQARDIPGCHEKNRGGCSRNYKKRIGFASN